MLNSAALSKLACRTYCHMCPFGSHLQRTYSFALEQIHALYTIQYKMLYFLFLYILSMWLMSTYFMVILL